MEPATILNSIAGAAIIGWIAWVSINMIAIINRNGLQKQQMLDMITKFDTVHTDLKNGFTNMQSAVTGEIEDVNKRFDLFLKSEIDTLKDIAKATRSHEQ